MGCGKSSVGRRLAAMLGCDFADLDELIAARAGRSIPEIFAAEGEEAFRARELDALSSVLSPGRADLPDEVPGRSDVAAWASSHQSPVPAGDLVLSLGGGTPVRPEARRLLRESGATCIYLRAQAGTLRNRLSGEGIKARPMLTQRPLEELLAERESIYQELADIVLDTDDLSTHEVAQFLAAELSSRASSHNVSPSLLTSPLP